MRGSVDVHLIRRDEVAVRVGEILRAARISLRLSQEDVAAQAGVTTVTYGCLERGRNPQGSAANPTLDTLLRVMTVLRLDATLVAEGDRADSGGPEN